jgi:hypothetical protein
MNIKTQQHPWNVYEGITWSAFDDDTYDNAPDSHCPVGNGRTEIEAINDLVEQIVERLETQLDRLTQRGERAMGRMDDEETPQEIDDSCPF